MHVCYLCCFYGNPLILRSNLLEFFNKSIISLLQTIKSHQNNQVFGHEVKEILETFVAHLNRPTSNDAEQNVKFDTFRKSIEDLNTELNNEFDALNIK